LTRDQALAEDVVQETLLRAWKHLDTLQEDVAARAWLLTIARHEVARMFRRKKANTTDIEDLSAADEVILACHATPEIVEVRKAIWSLPDEYREPLMLQVMLGFTTQEIADRMGTTQAAVLIRLFRARNKLHETLGPMPDDGHD
jgi:RNA polymerase sigma-70 factor (ECF subfamily)